jgi:signal transduction histidine kinase
LKRVLAEVEAAAPGWKIDLDATGDALGEWDGDRLAQVISNLAGNAVQHGARDAPLRVSLDGADPSAVALTFENKGAIAPELGPALFEPFRRDQRPRDTSRGVGLGLFITKAIIVAHGGEITAASAPEIGTRFQIVLPRRRGSQETGVMSPSQGAAGHGARPRDRHPS